MTVLLVLTAAAALLALGWWIRRCGMAVQPATALALGRVAPGCDIGEQLLMASTTETVGPTTGGRGVPRGGGSGRPQRRRKPSGPSRRAFLRNSMAIAWLGVLGGFGAATLSFLWPSLRGGFGAVLEVDDVDAIIDYIRENREPYPFPAGRSYIVEYDASLDPDGQYAEVTDEQNTSLMALYQVCVHLGCKVPWCMTSQWFECPCHGSRYNRWGEYRGGPAPRGLDRFAAHVEDGKFVIDTSSIVEGPSRVINVLDQPAEGASCV